MKKTILIFGLSIFLSSFVTAQSCFNRFRIRHAFQQTPMWCWAATIQTLMNFHYPNNEIDQCKIVSSYFGTDDCSDPNLALRGGYMPQMKQFLENNDLGMTFSCDYETGPLSVEEIIDNITNCKPIIIQLKLSPFSNSTHAVVIMGIWRKTDNFGNPFIEVVLKDPYPYNWNSIVTNGLNGIEYNRLASIWVSSIYNIQPE